MLLLLLSAFHQTATPPAQAEQPPLVAVDWLAQHVHDPDLLLFEIGSDRTRPAYEAGHIPGARFLNPFEQLAAPRVEGGLSLELPPLGQLTEALQAMGVTGRSHLVLYLGEGIPGSPVTPATRAFFTLEYAGLRGRVSLLDGGLAAWKAAGHPPSTEVPPAARGTFVPRPVPGLVVDAAWLAPRLTDPGVTVLDARLREFYDGADTHQARNGRIPGAASFPYASALEADGRFKSPEALRAMLVAASATQGKRVVTYCHIGQQASLVWFVARMLGYDAAVYDGSFQDWSARRELPVIPPAPQRPL